MEVGSRVVAPSEERKAGANFTVRVCSEAMLCQVFRGVSRNKPRPPIIADSSFALIADGVKMFPVLL